MIAMVLYRLADLVVRLLPAPVVDGLGIGLARLAFALGLPARRALEANLARLLGQAPGRPVRRLARQAFEHFALSFVDFLRMGHLDPRRIAAALDVHGAEHLAAARASGRGVIVVSAHLGNWEWGAAFLAAHGTPLHLVARPHASASVERFFELRRGAWGVACLPDRPLWKEAARALRKREWVALMADRSSAESPGSACAWAAALSRRTGALVLPAVMIRLPGRRYAAFIEPPVGPERVRALAFRDTLEQYLRRYPAQWSAFEPLPEGLA